MKAPVVTEWMGFINYAWPDLGLRVLAERVTDDGYTELRFFSANRTVDSLLHTTRVNLMSTSTMNSLVKRLKEHSEEAPWTDILTFITGKTMEIVRRGEPAIEIWLSEDDDLASQYLLEPILYLNHPTVIFGDYGSCKSLTVLVIAYIVQLPFYDNDFGLITNSESTHCLYLDYEDDHDSFRRRWSALERGFGKGTMPIVYKRMTSPLSDSIEQIQRIIQDKDINLIITDSLGPAARGNLNDPEPAIKCHAALRQLNKTSLTLAHTAKDPILKKRTIFGSVFFTNLAWSVWDCKNEQEVGEDEITISLKHIKANMSKLHLPLGFRLCFEDRAIKLGRADLRDTSISGDLPLPWQIKNLLKEGPLIMKEIAEILEKSEDSIKTTLTRMAKKEELVKLHEHKWGLRALEN